MPAAYEGSDAAVAELRELRREAVEVCEVARFDAAELAQAVAPLSEPLPVTLPAGRLPVELPAGPLAITGTVDLADPVEATDVGPVVQTVEDANEAVRATLWFLAGLLSVLVAVPFVVREFAP